VTELAIETRDITVGYGGAAVIRGLSMSVPAGEITAIVGPNGAGKSTLLKTLSGELRPTAGSVWFMGHDVTGWPTERLVKAGIAYVPQVANVFPSLSVRENLEVGGHLRRAGTKARIRQLCDLFPDLEPALPRKAGTLSGGQRNMLALARALVPEPQVLLVDEPTAGLAPRYVDAVWEHIATVRSEGVAILVVEQNTRRSLAHSDWAYVLVLGVSVAHGPGSHLLADSRLSDLYIGRNGHARDDNS
jgi:ABC-type branched-subunit amino acid transport system ATPase component